jgi:hypothetical protein
MTFVSTPTAAREDNMLVEVPLRMRFPIRRRLVESHCVRKTRLEEVLVSGLQTDLQVRLNVRLAPHHRQLVAINNGAAVVFLSMKNRLQERNIFLTMKSGM